MELNEENEGIETDSLNMFSTVENEGSETSYDKCDEANTKDERSGRRQRKPTVAYQQFQRETCETSMRAALSSWRKQAADLQKLLADSQDVEELRHARDDLHSKMSDLTSVFNRMLEIAPDYTTSPLGSQYENVEKENLQIGKEVCRTIRELDGESSSVGSRSSVVSRASSISKRADIASEAAGLKAKLKYYDEIEKRKVELGKMKMIRNLEIAEAQIEAVKRVECEEGMNLGFGEKPASASLAPQDKEQYVEDFVQTTLDHVISEQDVSPEQLLSVQAPEFRPQRSNESVEVHNPQTPTRPPDTQILDITKSITEQILLSRLPPPEPGIFSGDPIAYPGWKSAFETLVDRRGIPRSERMHYLKRYLGGSAKEAIEGYFLVCNDDSYEEAKRLLERRYGDPFLVATAFRNRLDSWPKLSPRDGHGLRRLADFLRQCDSAMNTFDSLNVLNDDREMQKVLNKLPDWLVSRWCRLVVEWKEKYMRLPPFREFMKFVEKEANIACDPTMSLQAVRGSTLNDIEKREKYFKPSQNDQKRVIRNTLSTETSRVEKQNRDRNTQKKGLCALCSKNHFINECEQFLSKSMDERKDIIMTRGLCYGCLRRGHRSRECPEKSVCGVCSKRHPSSLHGDFKKDCAENGPETKEPFHVHSSNEPAQRHQNNRMVQSKTTRADVNGTESASMCSMILPVYVSHWQDPSNEVLTYALLDTQSDTTFVVSSVCEALGVNGPSVKLIMSTMSSQAEPVDSRKIKGLRVRGHNSQTTISLPPSYTQRLIPGNKSHIPTPEVARRFEHLSQISDELMPLLNVPMGLLIGYDCAQAFTPREVIAQGGMEPYAQRTDLGWGIVGVTNLHLINDEESDPCNHFGYSHRIMTLGLPNDTSDVLSSAKTHQEAHVILSSQVSVKETMTPNDVSRMLELDFVDHGSQSEKMISQEDKKFLSLMEKGIHQTADGHYEMPLPVKDPCLELPNNRNQAENRLKHLKGRFLKDERFYQDYKKFMDSMIESGYAEVVDDSEVAKSNLVWYIPHHGVYHPQKPHKIRVVFDCSSRFQGHCLNDHLMQGPDLMNSLVGVLCRFRQEEIAFICDVEQMFFQFGVNAEHRDLLRFLWWEDGVYDKDPVVYRMRVHLFGATSSPGCANFGMKTIANDFKEIHGTDAANFLKRDFYVDDGLGSRSTPEKAVELIQATRQMCKNGGLRLHKFASNSREVLQCLPEQDRAANLQKIDLLTDHLPLERALGVQWCVQSDTFQFHITLKDQPLTRRGILSSISSIYDPLGFLAPVILVGKQILQQMVKEQTDWDAELPDDIRTKWEKWRSDLFYLKDFQVPRCLKPPATDLDEDHCAELHYFSDASSTGYGQVTYLRLKDSQKQVHCAFVMAKSRVAPVRTMTIPRLELTAAVVSVRMSNLLQGELDFGEVKHVFWTDSKIVLGYISNESRRFHVFVANRIEQIKRHTNTDQWNYVASSDNPADTASRGLTARQLVLSETWLRGPKFLLQENIPEVHAEDAELNWIEDPEVKPVKSLSTSAEVSQNAFDLKHFENFSSYSRLRRAVANCIRIQQIFKHRRTSSLCVGDLQFAEREITRLVQSPAFSEEMKLLSSAEKLDGDRKRDDVSRRKRSLKKAHRIQRLDPFIDDSGILRVGGRLRRSDQSFLEKHPAILPRKHHVTNLIARYLHEQVAHQGRGTTVNAIREHGFWILGCSGVVSRLIYNCVACRRLRSQTQTQYMSDLPRERLIAEAPFTYCGLDCFGPWTIKEGRKEVKRYGVLFTCLSSRAIHIETVNSMTTDSFINALRRLIAIRGNVREIRCDQGSNFVGAEKELKRAVRELDTEQINQFLLKKHCDFINFTMNVPTASHMGGVWERQIWTVRNVLSGLLTHSGEQLDDEFLRTLLCDVTAIVNSRPLAVDNLNDPTSVKPLSPNNLLMMKSKAVLPPWGKFTREDLYCRKRWRRVQHLGDVFWHRWRLEYLQNLQRRQKWNKRTRDFQIDDIVIVQDDNAPRCAWRLGRISHVVTDDDGCVRKVSLTFSDGSVLQRPIHKLVLLLEASKQ